MASSASMLVTALCCVQVGTHLHCVQVGASIKVVCPVAGLAVMWYSNVVGLATNGGSKTPNRNYLISSLVSYVTLSGLLELIIMLKFSVLALLYMYMLISDSLLFPPHGLKHIQGKCTVDKLSHAPSVHMRTSAVDLRHNI